MLKVEHLHHKTKALSITLRAWREYLKGRRETYSCGLRNAYHSTQKQQYQWGEKKHLKGKKSCRTQTGNKKEMQIKWTALLKRAAVLCGRNMITAGIETHKWEWIYWRMEAWEVIALPLSWASGMGLYHMAEQKEALLHLPTKCQKCW